MSERRVPAYVESGLKRALLTALLFTLLLPVASASVTVNATLQDGQGNPLQFAFLKFHLNYCGYNVPQVPGQPSSMVAKDLVLTPSQLPATLYANNEITCGGSYSTLWHVTAYVDQSTPIVGDADFDLCSTTSNCASGTTTVSWNLSSAQPFTPTATNPPPPGYIALFGNPTGSQTILQPATTSLFINGTLDLTHATVVGFGNGAGNPASPANSLQFNNGGAFGGVPNASVNSSTGAITTNSIFTELPTGVFNNSQANLYVYSQVGSLNFAGTGLPNETDAFTGVTTLPVGATVHQGNGVTGVCYSNAVSSPLGTSATCVGVFGVGAALVNNSASYGANFGSSAAAGTSGTLVIGNEVDLGLVSTSAPTRFQGLFVTGAALNGTMPAGPVMGTLNVASNSASAYGVAFPSGSAQFPVAYWSSRGSAFNGLMLDCQSYSGACNSQTILLGSNNGSSAFTNTIQSNQKGELFFSNNATGFGIGPPDYAIANLSGSASNGTILYCTDCKNIPDDSATAGAACVGSGHGTVARRDNGRWDCN